MLIFMIIPDNLLFGVAMILFDKIICRRHQLVSRQLHDWQVLRETLQDRRPIAPAVETRIEDRRNPVVVSGPDQAANPLTQTHCRLRQGGPVEGVATLTLEQVVVGPGHHLIGGVKRQPGDDQKLQGGLGQVNPLPETSGAEQDGVLAIGKLLEQLLPATGDSLGQDVALVKEVGATQLAVNLFDHHQGVEEDHRLAVGLLGQLVDRLAQVADVLGVVLAVGHRGVGGHQETGMLLVVKWRGEALGQGRLPVKVQLLVKVARPARREEGRADEEWLGEVRVDVFG